MDFLHFLYDTVPGRMLLKPLTSRTFSRLGGKLMDSRLSACLIRPFAARCGIDLSLYEMDDVRTFNDFFSRKIKDGLRPFDEDPSHLIAPCDGLLRIVPIEADTVLEIKNCRYTVSSLLRDKKLAGRYDGGLCFIFRLCVDHYHRYVYADSGMKSENRFLPGRLHTVRPAALERVPVFIENCREYTLIRSNTFGVLLQMEVGAMLVGRIVNHDGAGWAERGSEKGCFQYGGSTVILLAQEGKAEPLEKFRLHAEDIEIPVRMGEIIASK